MAYNFGQPNSPEDTVKARKKALEDFTNIIPAQEAQNKFERDSLARDAAVKSAKPQVKPQAGQVQNTGLQGLGTLGMLQKAVPAAGKMVAQQGATMDKLNLQGAMQQQNIANAKTKQATENTIRGMENETQRMARLVADRAFEAGYQAKELIYSKNNALADYTLGALRKDFAEGRLSAREVRDLSNNFKIDALKKKQTADEALKKVQEEFETGITSANADRAKSRILYLIAKQKEAMESAAKAQATSSILTGTLTIFGGVIGGIYGGPDGAAAGSAGGGALGGILSGAVNRT